VVHFEVKKLHLSSQLYRTHGGTLQRYPRFPSCI